MLQVVQDGCLKKLNQQIPKLKSNLFPVVCVDGFYDDPVAIKRFAEEQNYARDPSGRWQGERTDPIDQLSQDLFSEFCEKLFSIYFDLNYTYVEWVVTTKFHRIDPCGYQKSWIHADDEVCSIAGVIYLDEDQDPNAGTKIYTPKNNLNLDDFDKWNEKKSAFILNGDETGYEESLNNQHSFFDESVSVKNSFNRLVSYESNQYHAPVLSTTKPRLTQVFFVNMLKTDDQYPMNRMRNAKYFYGKKTKLSVVR
jgi:hypothetical protein